METVAKNLAPQKSISGKNLRFNLTLLVILFFIIFGAISLYFLINSPA